MIRSCNHLFAAALRIVREQVVRIHAAAFSVAAPFRASMALTEFSKALFKTPAYGSQHEAEYPSLQVLALGHDD